MSASATRCRRVTAATALAVLLSISAAAPAQAATPSIEVSATHVSLVSPAPGHAREWSFDVTNTGTDPVRAGFELESITGELLAGPHPARLTILADGREIAAGGLDLLTEGTIPLGELQPSEAIHIVGRLSLPTVADDTYRTATADLRWRVTAIGLHDDDGMLASTGIQVATWLAFPLLGLGAFVLVVGFRRTRDAREEQP